MINEEIREMSHRESVQDYTNYINRRKSQIAQLKKEPSNDKRWSMLIKWLELFNKTI